MQETRTFAADDLSLAAVGEILGNRLETESPVVVRVSFLETFDWRLFNAGCRLTFERRGGRTVLR